MQSSDYCCAHRLINNSGKLVFLTLRQQAFTVQAVLEKSADVSNAMLKFAQGYATVYYIYTL
jgi:aspartyl/asparaginyl-tRNA synthetase